jgi:2-polyprenyl-6-methoxyphenol hydroxylase-like FAD-dependent oxidoreductase
MDDVVIVGAGPTGLMLACELALAGVHPVVLERLDEPTGLSKALALVGRSVDMLDHRGLLDRFAAYAPVGAAGFAHFALTPLDLSALAGLGVRGVSIQQARTEQILLGRALELGVEVRPGRQVVGLEQDRDGVTVDLGEERMRTRWVVGCDGGSSVVRKAAGIGFPGLGPSRLLRLADVTMPNGVAKDDHIALPDGARSPYVRGGVVPLGEGIFRIITNEPYPDGFDRDAPLTLDELQSSIRRTTGHELPIGEVRWMSRFTDASRQADSYRAGRVLLAGDAAHIHLPAGGPGLNTGLQDAVNLGWKLAAEVQGRAPEGLLDTYQAERHPEGTRVLMHTRAQGALLIEDDRMASLRELFRQLLANAEITQQIGGLLYAMDTRYDMGVADAHPLIGRWAPDLVMRDGTRLAEHMNTARGLLVGTECPGWADRVDAVDPGAGEAVLVRPDGYVAWTGPPRHAGLPEALTRWFGPAR